MPSQFTDQQLKQFGGPANISSEEMQQLAMMVAESLSEGEDPNEIVDDLTNGGWEQDDAIGFVESVQFHLLEAQHSHQGGGSGIPGWIGWIAFLIGFNVLSHLFGWGIRIF